MLKRVFGRKLGRGRSTRRALFRGLMSELFDHGSIKTTEAKAKAVVPEIDSILVSAKKGGLSPRRQVFAKLGNNRKITDKIFGQIVPAIANRNSGFTKITRLLKRKGDGATVVRLELMDKVVSVVKTTEAKAKKDTKKNENLPTKGKRNK